MTELQVFLLLMAVNFGIACGYLAWGIVLVPHVRKKRPDREAETYSRASYLIRVAVMLICPVAGPLFFLAGQLVHLLFFRQAVDLQDIIFSKERVEKRVRADTEREGNMVPMEEALAVSDSESLRTLMMDIIRRDTKQSLTSIARALNSEDSETSHYAAAVLRDELNGFRQHTQEIYRHMKEDGSDACEYAGLLLEYMNGLLAQKVFPDLEQKAYVAMMEETGRFLLEREGDLLTAGYLEWICLRLLEIRDFEHMQFWCDVSRERYPDELFTYTCRLKMYFTQGDRKRFFEVLNRLKKSDIVIDRETLDLMRIFS